MYVIVVLIIMLVMVLLDNLSILRRFDNYKRAQKEVEEKAREDAILDADNWLHIHLPRVISNYPYEGKRVDMLNEDMREDFRNYMHNSVVITTKTKDEDK